MCVYMYVCVYICISVFVCYFQAFREHGASASVDAGVAVLPTLLTDLRLAESVARIRSTKPRLQVRTKAPQTAGS